MSDYIELVASLLLIAILIIEILLAVRVKFGLRAEIVVGILVITASIAWFFFVSASEYARENKPSLLLLNNILFVIVPIGIFILINEFHTKLKNMWVMHLSAISIAIIVAFVYPLFALHVSCFTGLDCL